MHFSMKKSCRGKVYVCLVVILMIVIICTVIFRIDKLYTMRTMAYAKNIGTNIINKAVNNTLEKNTGIEGFTNIYQTSENKITGAENNTLLMNKFKADVTNEIHNLIQNQPIQIVEIPLGNILGIAVFNNRGISVPIRLSPISSISSDFEDEFENCGINNTKHSLYIKVEIELELLSYFSQNKQVVTEKVPISETLIAGEVPAYFSTNGNIGYVPENIR